MTVTKQLLTLLTILLLANLVSGQEQSKFNFEYIASDYVDSTSQKSVIAVFAVTPIKRKDFPPVLSMKLTYRVNDQETETVVNVLKQTEKKISLVIYGSSVKEKNSKLYELIKNKIDLTNESEIMLLVFKLDNISSDSIRNLELKYGLWEKRNQDIRIEKKFNFKIRE